MRLHGKLTLYRVRRVYGLDDVMVIVSYRNMTIAWQKFEIQETEKHDDFIDRTIRDHDSKEIDERLRQ
jgi:hypothetical protein